MTQPPPDDGADDGVVSAEPLGFAMADPVRQRRTSATGFLIDAFRRRRIGRATLSGLTIVLFLAGVGMFAYPFITDVYTSQVVQKGLQEEFDEIQVASFEEWEAEVAGETGKPLTKIVLPKLDVATLVVEGTSPSALRAGAGHYPNTPLPGQVGNVAIAGHRTTYGRPFNRLDQMRPGDDVWLVTPVADHRYVVVSAREAGWIANPYITTPKDWSVVAPTSDASLTLTTCHPKGSAAERLVLRAELAETFEAGYYDRTVAAAA
ncbi:MAG: class E sortase [Actinobacteria bacterium]|nr:class E sortase [Actinomycetota bacterium]